MPINVVLYQGHLGSEPRVLVTRRNETMVFLNVACNESYRNAEGERKETTTWISVACYGKVADLVTTTLKLAVGDEILVQGRLISYTRNDRGARRVAVQIAARDLRVVRRSNNRPEKHYESRPAEDDDVPF